jgi:hypothetical protein
MDDVKDWTGRKTGDLIRFAEERTTWCRIVNSAGSPQMAAWLRDMMMMMMIWHLRQNRVELVVEEQIFSPGTGGGDFNAYTTVNFAKMHNLAMISI